MRKRLKITTEDGKSYKFTAEQLNVAYSAVNLMDKMECAALYLRNYCHFNDEDFTDDEWWLCCTTLSDLYEEKFNNGGNNSIWKSACDEFVEMYEKGEVI
jgi:hypothetical protein